MGWMEYVSWTKLPWNMDWLDTEGECWGRLAKWPDGKPFSLWDGLTNDTPDGSSEKDQWRDTVRRKLKECEASHVRPISERMLVQLQEPHVQN